MRLIRQYRIKLANETLKDPKDSQQSDDYQPMSPLHVRFLPFVRVPLHPFRPLLA
jgi:hypothetical protein